MDFINSYLDLNHLIINQPITDNSDIAILLDLYKNNKLPVLSLDKQKNLAKFISVYYLINKNYSLMNKYISLLPDPVKYNILAIYYERINNIDLMVQSYLIAYEKNSLAALNNLALYYREKKFVKLAKKYYKLGVSKNCGLCITGLASYYKFLQNNIKMVKYYELAADQDIPEALVELSKYYLDNNKPKLAKKYYLKGLKINNPEIIYNFGLYYFKKNKFEKYQKYLLVACDLNYIQAISNLQDHYLINKNYEKLFSHLLKYNQPGINKIFLDLDILEFNFSGNLLEIIKQFNPENINIPILKILNNILNKNIDLLDIHFKYNLTGSGFLEAKSDYYKRISEY